MMNKLSVCFLSSLTGWQVQQDGMRTSTHRMAYEANGNLTYLDGTGTLEYAHPQKPYAVTGMYAAGAVPEMGFEHEIEYTSFYRPASITSDTLVTSTATTPGATCATRKRWRPTHPAKNPNCSSTGASRVTNTSQPTASST